MAAQLAIPGLNPSRGPSPIPRTSTVCRVCCSMAPDLRSPASRLRELTPDLPFRFSGTPCTVRKTWTQRVSLRGGVLVGFGDLQAVSVRFLNHVLADSP